MAKNIILLWYRINQFIFFACSLIGISSCNSIIQDDYFRYYVGTMRINDPIVVEFYDSYYTWYVCSNSALYCCNDSDWLDRNDVYPYIPVAEKNSPMTTYFPRNELCHLPYFQYDYLPFYEFGQINNHITYKFYYGLNKFECYMQTTDECLHADLEDVELINEDTHTGSDANLSVCTANEKEYRMVVRHKYTIFQILKLKHKYKDYFNRDH